MEDRPHESATYLWVAETILRKYGRALRARQIVTYGMEEGLFGDAELSRTPQKSMQARLSVDILEKGTRSRFLRTERGKFFLRDLVNPKESSSGTAEYTAVRHAPRPPSEDVLVVPRSHYASLLGFQGIRLDYEETLKSLVETQSLRYMPRVEAETDSSYKQFVTYTIIQQRDRILAFKRGRYNRAAAFLRGARCIGFGGHVTEEDLSILSYPDRGIRANAARELSEEIRLASGAPKINMDEIEPLGFLNDDSSDVGVRHVAAVLRYWAPEDSEWKAPTRGEASVSQLKWLKINSPEIDLLEFEYWSQLCLRKFFPTFVSSKPAFKVLRKSAFEEPHLLVVTGSIGSGKSSTTRRLCQRAGYVELNSGAVLADLLGIPPVPNTPRDEFQKRAYEFITSKDGPRNLAQSLATRASSLGAIRVIVDGIRHAETLEELRARSSLRVSTLFVYTPPDVAYELYKIREVSDISLHEFMDHYNAPVETEVRSLIEEADAIIYNWYGLESFELVVDNLIGELGVAR
ncbi:MULTISPECIES: HTH domain-containing protein [Bradyrhizobium]|uniref:HTH domain-containing protein n=1 Tax=Bradyrhizobium TaxID=374 RepID=UPI00155DDFBA|nr:MULTISPECIES: HTH domain-containing protein [Bradyrhizobium]